MARFYTHKKKKVEETAMGDNKNNNSRPTFQQCAFVKDTKEDKTWGGGGGACTFQHLSIHCSDHHLKMYIYNRKGGGKNYNSFQNTMYKTKISCTYE